ncbi:MAG: hypothetical protein H0X51_04570 [Parachlamydiaceae bacterium]|nr:hypothetical protein [Parachlamydiaceae bacterium]
MPDPIDQQVEQRRVVTPWNPYEGFYDTRLPDAPSRVAPPVMTPDAPTKPKGVPPGPLYDSQAPFQKLENDLFAPIKKALSRRPWLPAPKVTADPKTQSAEWYQQMMKLTTRTGLEDIITHETDHLKQVLHALLDKKHTYDGLQRTSAETIHKNQGVAKKQREEMQDCDLKHAKLGRLEWFVGWASWIVTGTILVVGGVAVVGMVSGPAGLPGAVSFGNSAMQTALAAAQAATTATKGFLDHRADKHKQAQEGRRAEMKKEQGKTKNALEQMEQSTEHIHRAIRAAKEAAKSEAQAIKAG